jgi:hypothetical protein
VQFIPLNFVSSLVLFSLTIVFSVNDIWMYETTDNDFLPENNNFLKESNSVRNFRNGNETKRKVVKRN